MADKNRKAMTEALISNNKLIQQQLKDREGWTDDEIDDIVEELIDRRLKELKADCVSVEELDAMAGGDDYFDSVS